MTRQGAANAVNKRSRRLLGTIRRLQKVSQSHSDGFKIAPRAPTMPSIKFQETPTSAPPPRGFRMPSSHFQEVSRRLPEPSNRLQESPDAPQSSQDTQKSPPKRPPNALRSPSGLQMPFRAPLNLRGLIPSFVPQANNEPRPGCGI